MNVISRSGLVEENTVEVLHHNGVHCPLPSWCKFSVGWQVYVTMKTIWKNAGSFVYDWLIGMLLVSRSALVEENAVEVLHHNGVHCPLPSWSKFSVGWQVYVTMKTIWKNTGGFVYNWLIGMLLVSRSGLVEENAVEVFITMVFSLVLFFLYVKF